MQEDSLGALNLCGVTGARFGDKERTIGEVLAAHAALALSGAPQYRRMSQALSTRDAVGQTKGMLMQSDDLTGQQAFDLLVRASQHANIKLSEVAQWLIDEHEGRDRAERPRAS